MIYVPPSQQATKARPRSKAAPKYKNKKIDFRGMKFDSIGERDRYVFLLSEQEKRNIRNLQRQVKFPLTIKGEHICFYIADFTYEKCLGMVHDVSPLPANAFVDPNGRVFINVVEDFKGMITDVFDLKSKMFKAIYGYDIVITKRPSWRSSNALEGKSWKHS